MATLKNASFIIAFLLLASTFKLAATEKPIITGVRIINSTIEEHVKASSSEEELLPKFESDQHTAFYLYGYNFSEDMLVVLTLENITKNNKCDNIARTKSFNVDFINENVAHVVMNYHQPPRSGKVYLCISSNDGHYYHMGSDPWVTTKIQIVNDTIPLPLRISLIAVLLVLSGLFSGLNLGLMSLDPIELQIIMSSGTKKEQKFAKKIHPVRKKGNFLLCTLLLGNVLVNSTFTILLDDLTNGVWAIIGSTAGIVVFGEIFPQAVCSRYGLHVGAYTIWITKFFMFVTFVLSWPISKLLDIILGKEIGTVYNRKKLMEMIKIHDPYNDLKKDEVNIIQGALELRSKTVKEVMTPLQNCYMISMNSKLDFKTMQEIMHTGFTRIPVYDGDDRANIQSILFVKDLAFVDPEDAIPLLAVCRTYQHAVNYVFSDSTLDQLLEKFKKGAFHMAIVQQVNNEGPGDPFYEVIGIITLEDVIEEIIKAEIVDETDQYTDNRSNTRNDMRHALPQDLTLFNSHNDSVRSITPQLTLAAVRYLQAEVDPFKQISEKVLLRLLNQNVLVELEKRELEKFPEKQFIYKKGVPSDYFVLILEGTVQVQVGNEQLNFESGPFTYYGKTALSQSEGRKSMGLNNTEVKRPSQDRSAFKPDFSLIAHEDVKYIKITWKQFEKALKTTQMSGSMSLKASAGLNEDDVSISLSSTHLSPSREKTEEDDQHLVVTTNSTSALLTTNPHHRHKYLKDQNKSMSSDQLRALAQTYSKVAGDRLRPSHLQKEHPALVTKATSNQDSDKDPLLEPKKSGKADLDQTLAPVAGPPHLMRSDDEAIVTSSANSNNNNQVQAANQLQDDEIGERTSFVVGSIGR